MTHFHIRWIGERAKLDWEAFTTQVEAERTATELVQPDETFVIEEFDGNCPQCPPKGADRRASPGKSELLA